MAETRPKPVDPDPSTQKDEEDASGVRELVLQTEILDELRRMNRLLGALAAWAHPIKCELIGAFFNGLGQKMPIQACSNGSMPTESRPFYIPKHPTERAA